jgi:hypothetical protein
VDLVLVAYKRQATLQRVAAGRTDDVTDQQ